MKLSYIYLVENKNKILANGCIFEDGKICIQWKGENRSVVIWDSIDDFRSISCKEGMNRNIIVCCDQLARDIEQSKCPDSCVSKLFAETENNI